LGVRRGRWRIEKNPKNSHETPLLGVPQLHETLPLYLRKTAIEIIGSTLGGRVEKS
jgi:hypothetical protein